MAGFDAIVVAGGRGSRLGGADKAAIVVAGRNLLQRARDAVAGADRVTVVGPETAGGPVAAVAAGLAGGGAAVTVVLACDMPLVTRETVARLRAALDGGSEAALLTDESGRRQFLAGAYDTAALRRAIRRVGAPDGRAMRDLMAHLRVHEVSAQPEEAVDCDTWADVRRASMLLEER